MIWIFSVSCARLAANSAYRWFWSVEAQLQEHKIYSNISDLCFDETAEIHTEHQGFPRWTIPPAMLRNVIHWSEIPTHAANASEITKCIEVRSTASCFFSHPLFEGADHHVQNLIQRKLVHLNMACVEKKLSSEDVHQQSWSSLKSRYNSQQPKKTRWNLMKHEPWKTKTSYFPLYWLVNRDPYNSGLLIIIHI